MVMKILLFLQLAIHDLFLQNNLQLALEYILLKKQNQHFLSLLDIPLDFLLKVLNAQVILN